MNYNETQVVLTYSIRGAQRLKGRYIYSKVDDSNSDEFNPANARINPKQSKFAEDFSTKKVINLGHEFCNFNMGTKSYRKDYNMSPKQFSRLSAEQRLKYAATEYLLSQPDFDGETFSIEII